MSAETEESEDRAIEERVKRACAELGEHVDSVRVFVTHNHGSGRTARFTWHAGNWYASLGQIKDWLIEKDEQTREQTRQDIRNEQDSE